MTMEKDEKGERIAKRLARAGIASRRVVERMILEGRVKLNGKLLDTPATLVTDADKITVDGKRVGEKEHTRLWLYHKPRGLVTSHNDDQGRPTVFEHLPKELPRVVSVGRLDLSSEGLLLLTNDGALSRHLEMPKTALKRKYRVRAFGRVTQEKLDRLQNGITVDGVSYGAIDAVLEKGEGANVWIIMTLTEGKNREIRRVLEHLGLEVNRLIRVSYGPFELGQLKPGEGQEIEHHILKKYFGALIS